MSADWYMIRDMLLGQNFVEQNVKEALLLAANCSHSDGQKLHALFVNNNNASSFPSTPGEACKVFMAGKDQDPLFACFAACLTEDGAHDVGLLREASERNCALAQVLFAHSIRRGHPNRPQIMFSLASTAAAQDERDAYALLAYCFQIGLGCDVNEKKSFENYRKAAEFSHGNVISMVRYGQMLPNNQLRWKYWGKAAIRGAPEEFFKHCAAEIKGSSVANVYEIGKTFHGRLNVEQQTLMGSKYRFSQCGFEASKAAIEVFRALQRVPAKRAVDTWTLVGLRNHVVKDIRILIGKLIWEDTEAQYECGFEDVNIVVKHNEETNSNVIVVMPNGRSQGCAIN